ncbi:MAG TPA: DUF1801 domain-containing protein [Candidatus Paceibacterota bacterium]
MKSETVPAYIAATSTAAQKKLREIRAAVRAAAPGCTESLKWDMPAASYKRILVTYCDFKSHVSIFPTTSPVRKFAKELKKYATSRGTIQFPLDKPLPIALIKKVVAFRAKEEREEDAKWRS